MESSPPVESSPKVEVGPLTWEELADALKDWSAALALAARALPDAYRLMVPKEHPIYTDEQEVDWLTYGAAERLGVALRGVQAALLEAQTQALAFDRRRRRRGERGE
jgi:hypothetical protein